MDRKSDMVDAYLAVQTNLSFTTEHGVTRGPSQLHPPARQKANLRLRWRWRRRLHALVAA